MPDRNYSSMIMSPSNKIGVGRVSEMVAAVVIVDAFLLL